MNGIVGDQLNELLLARTKQQRKECQLLQNTFLQEINHHDDIILTYHHREVIIQHRGAD